jgi:hypothetical protein
MINNYLKSINIQFLGVVSEVTNLAKDELQNEKAEKKEKDKI